MKCRNSAFNSQGSRIIVVVVQVVYDQTQGSSVHIDNFTIYS